jgi:hypothetical protein
MFVHMSSRYFDKLTCRLLMTSWYFNKLTYYLHKSPQYFYKLTSRLHKSSSYFDNLTCHLHKTWCELHMVTCSNDKIISSLHKIAKHWSHKTVTAFHRILRLYRTIKPTWPYAVYLHSQDRAISANDQRIRPALF